MQFDTVTALDTFAGSRERGGGRAVRCRESQFCLIRPHTTAKRAFGAVQILEGSCAGWGRACGKLADAAWAVWLCAVCSELSTPEQAAYGEHELQ